MTKESNVKEPNSIKPCFFRFLKRYYKRIEERMEEKTLLINTNNELAKGDEGKRINNSIN